MKDLERAVANLAASLEKTPVEPFPWREKQEPYPILISEMMLIRTRADLVVDVYTMFIKRYPEASKLAAAEETELERLLEPLGLRKRIPFFRAAGEYIDEHFPDGLPSDRKELQKIPGVGRYTADAVLAFAFDLPVVPADVNVLRFISRITGLPMTHPSKGSKEIRGLLQELEVLSGRKAYKLLDFIRNICRPRKPDCINCSVRENCHFGSRSF